MTAIRRSHGSHRSHRWPAAVATAVAVVVAGCGDDAPAASSATASSTAPATSAADTPVIDPGDGGDYRPDITAADFVAGIDNPYLPLRPGARWVYESTE